MTGGWRYVLKATGLLFFLSGVAGLGLRGREAPTTRPGRPPVADPPAAADRPLYDPDAVNKTIAFWKSQAERDPQGGALEQRELAAAYLARVRETGDVAAAVEAEAAARRSIEILPRNNAAAVTHLARALLAQHRFPEALDAARLAAASGARADRLVADVLLELGDDDEARGTLGRSPRVPDDLNYLALSARLDSIEGRFDVALGRLREAADFADARPDMPAEAVAWYHAMVGHMLLDAGKLDEAERACRAALKVFPRDYRALTTLAAVSAWRGDWPSALSRGDQALAVNPRNPEALKLVGDAHAALGEDDEANRSYDRFKDLAHSFPRVYDRQWALFCADSGRDLDEALSLARADLKLRHDVHAYDTLAWVLFKKDLPVEADAVMRSALSRGTPEAAVLFHAGMIARAVDDPSRARTYFARARAINSRSVPLRWLRWMESEKG